MYIERIKNVFDKYFSDMFIWNVPSEIKEYLKNMMDDITNILTNYDTISSDEFLRIINKIYMITTEEDDEMKHYNFTAENLQESEYYDYSPIIDSEPLESHEMINLYNMAGNTSFKKITSIKTNMIKSYLKCQGHGKDYDEWEDYYQGYLIVLTDTDLDRNKLYTKEEIDEMIKNGVISVVTTSEVRISKKNIPKERGSFKFYGFDKNEEQYKAAFVKLLKEEIPKEKLYKDIRIFLNEIKNEFMDYCSYDERKEMYGAKELEDFYQLKFRYKKKWNNDRKNKVD